VILIDPEGRSAPGDAVAHKVRGATQRAQGGDYTGHAVRHLGYVEMAPMRAGMQVRLRPVLVSGAAAAQLFFSLADAKPEKVVIVRFDDALDVWRHEICGHWRKAFDRIQGLVFGREKAPAYVANELGTNRLGDPESGNLRALMDVWRFRGGKIDDSVIEAMRRLGVYDYSTVVDKTVRSDRLVYRHHGAKLRVYDEDWKRSAVGRDIEDQPDKIYAARAAANIRRCAVGEQPLFHRCEAIVKRDGQTTLQLAYRRLTLPWRTSNGGTSVTTTTAVEQHVEIGR
jgi:hypothetical protein